MNRQDIIKGLREQANMIRQEAESRMETLYEAADALEQITFTGSATESPTPKAHGKGNARADSVVNLIREAAISYGKDVVFDQTKLRDRAIERHVSEEKKIRVGIYNAVAHLVGKKELVRVPGGFSITEAMKIGEGTVEHAPAAAPGIDPATLA